MLLVVLLWFRACDLWMLIVLRLVASFALCAFAWVLDLVVCMWLLCLFGLGLRLVIRVVCG